MPDTQLCYQFPFKDWCSTRLFLSSYSYWACHQAHKAKIQICMLSTLLGSTLGLYLTNWYPGDTKSVQRNCFDLFLLKMT